MRHIRSRGGGGDYLFGGDDVKNIEFRFVFKNLKTGEIDTKIYSLGFLISMIITGKPDYILVNSDYNLIATDLLEK